MRRRWLLHSVALALLLVACGGDKPAGNIGNIGNIVDIGSPMGQLNGKEAFAEDDILSKAIISTDPMGELDFKLKEKINRCRLLSNTAVRVLPSRAVLVNYQKGTAWCITTRDPEKREFLTPAARIIASDPLFGVTAEKDRTIVRVVEGLVEVSSRAGGTGISVLVGPQQQSMIVRGQDPQSPTGFSPEGLSSAEQEAIQELSSKEMTPTLSPNSTLSRTRPSPSPTTGAAASPSPTTGAAASPSPTTGAAASPSPTDGIKASASASPIRELTRIPDCAGLPARDCDVRLRQAGFVPEQVAEPNESVGCGTVIGTDPPAGRSAPKGSKVKMRVSSGPSRKVIASGLGGAIGSRYDPVNDRLVFVEYAGKLSFVTLGCSPGYAVLGTGYDRPEDIALSRDGRTAYVTERGGNFLRVDLSNANRSAATLVASGLVVPHQIVLDESQGVAYTVEFPGRLVRINLANGAMTKLADVDYGIGLLLSADGQTAYVTEDLLNSTGRLIRIDLASGQRRVLFTSSTAALFEMSWADATRQAIYVPERDPANKVWLVDLAGTARLVVDNLPARPSSVTVVSSGRLLICSDSQITEISGRSSPKPSHRGLGMSEGATTSQGAWRRPMSRWSS